MAEEFTAKFKVDISDLKKNISEANKEIKLANATFKAETAGMDKWSNNADGLSKKLEQLKTVLNSQKSIMSSYQSQLERQQAAYEENGRRAEQLKAKLQELAQNGVSKTDEEYQKYEKALKNVVKEQQNNQSAIDQLQLAILNEKAAIGQTEKEIKKYEQAENDLGKEAEDASKEVDDLGKATEESGKDAEKGSDGYTVLKNVLANLATEAIKAAVDGLKKLGSAVKDTVMEVATMGDEIDKESQKLGLSAQTYQELSYAMERSGADIEDFKKGILNINNAMAGVQGGVEGAADTFTGLGVALENTDGSMRSSEEVLLDTIDALASMEDETARNAWANEIFGKSYTELAPLLNSGADGIKALMQEAEDYGMVMSDETVSASAEFEDSLTRLDGAVGGLKSRLVGELIPSFTEVVDGLSLMASGSEEGGKKLSDGIKHGLENINKLMPQLLKIGGEILKGLIEGISSNLDEILASALDLATTFGEAIVDNLPVITTAVSEALPTILDALITLITDLVSNISELIQPILDALPDIVRSILEALPELIQTILQEIPEIIDAILTIIPDIILAICEALPDIITAIIEELPGLIEKIAKSVIENFPKIVSAMWEGLKTVLEKLGTWFTDKALPAVGDFFTDVFTKVGDFFTDIVSDVGEFFSGLWEDLKGWFEDTLTKVWEFVQKIPEKIAEGFSAIKDAGKNLVEGLWNGINDAKDWVLDKIKGFGQSILDGIKGFFGIKSPSREMAWVGKMIDEGLAQGILKNKGGVMDEALGLAKDITGALSGVQNIQLGASGALGAFKGAGGILGLSGAAGGSLTNNNKTTNFTQNIYAPKQPSRLELYRQTRNLLQLATGGA